MRAAGDLFHPLLHPTPQPRDQDEYFPADLLFLSADNEDGLCYIETMQLDGETNLKIKKALDETKHLDVDALGSFQVGGSGVTAAAAPGRSCALVLDGWLGRTRLTHFVAPHAFALAPDPAGDGAL